MLYKNNNMSTRREFVRIAASAASLARASAQNKPVALIVEPSDAIAAAAPVQWAIGELESAFAARGVRARRIPSPGEAGKDDLCIGFSRAEVARTSEATGLIPTMLAGRQSILASGHDVRGVVYALLEPNYRVEHAPDDSRFRQSASKALK